MRTKLYIYVLEDPETGEVRYVGKAGVVEARRRAHINEVCSAVSINRDKEEWIQGLLSRGLEPAARAVEEVHDGNWREREAYWIAKFRAEGCRLTNGKSGPGRTPRRKELSAAEDRERQELLLPVWAYRGLKEAAFRHRKGGVRSFVRSLLINYLIWEGVNGEHAG